MSTERIKNSRPPLPGGRHRMDFSHRLHRELGERGLRLEKAHTARDAYTSYRVSSSEDERAAVAWVTEAGRIVRGRRIITVICPFCVAEHEHDVPTYDGFVAGRGRCARTPLRMAQPDPGVVNEVLSAEYLILDTLGANSE